MTPPTSRSRNDAPRCYMCKSKATSREHVPPVCLFPASAGSGESLRRNLITVPSCDKHNRKKSSDDEFLMASLAGIYGSNSTGYAHRFDKIQRAFIRTHHRLLRDVLPRPTHLTTESIDGEEVLFQWGTPDVERLERCFIHIAHGIYFHQYGRRFTGRMGIHLHYLKPPSENAKSWNAVLEHLATNDLAGHQKVGDNPTVFYYQISAPDNFGIRLMHLRFFENIPVFVALMPKRRQIPKDLTQLLIDQGHPLHLRLGERTYHFNTDRPILPP